MPEYRVQHSYASNHNGRRFGPWVEGETVDVDVADAEWVNRDSPDTLAGVDWAAELVAESVAEDLAEVIDAVIEELTAEPGEPLPDLPESAYPEGAVELEPVEPEPVVEAKPPVKRARR